MILLDHLVVAARNLEDGAAWLESRLGAVLSPGGKHVLMGTHNRLLSLGEGRYLELISVDPEAPPPGRARWFDLDSPAMQVRLARSPALIHWAVRTDDIEDAL
ncbi:MAG TPA: VOC family protein, partial [Usitatibacter sp.]|nr:VOC family protein [Usitatibacter sp.]